MLLKYNKIKRETFPDKRKYFLTKKEKNQGNYLSSEKCLKENTQKNQLMCETFNNKTTYEL